MEKIELKQCPFCGGNAKVSFKDYKYGCKTLNGDEKKSYRVQVICNKCRSRGKPIITPMLTNPSPYASQYYLSSRHDALVSLVPKEPNKHDVMFSPYIEQAIEAWNRRANDATD